MFENPLTPLGPWALRVAGRYLVMDPSDIEGSEYDLGTTSVKLIRAGNVIQLLYSNKREARFLYAELSSRFKRMQDELRRSYP